MDLSSMLNDGPPDEKPKTSAPQASPPIGGPSRGSYPPAALPAGQSQGRNLTPLHTPTNGQYPFASPSPINTAAGQQAYRPYEAYSATTPGGRPASHGHFAQPSPSYYGPGHPAHHTTSMSPTPSSHHSQTPHSMRQSPLATANHLPQQQTLPPHFHPSQPSTPLGPPPFVQRHSNQLDMASPYHQRNPSNASNGMTAHSPAQHYPSIGNLVESPNAHRPQVQRRGTSEYSRSADRERSLSVSPKTKVPARPPSLGSRHSSQQEVYSARGSVQRNSGVTPSSSTPSHVTAPPSNYGQPPYAHSTSGASQAHLHAPGSLSVNAGVGGPLSASNNQPAPQHHQSQKMGMNHLLAPTPQHEQYENSRPNNANTQASLARSNSNEQSKPDSYSSPATAPPSHEKVQLRVQSDLSMKTEKSESLPTSATSMPSKSSQSQPSEPKQQTGEVSSRESSQTKTPLKRAAESEPSAEPPAKRGRRKYTERPIWAHLSHQNPRSRDAGVVPNGALPSKSAATSARTNGDPPLQTNGQQVSPPLSGNLQAALDVLPWQQNPPLDHDLMRARKVLGPKWEKSINWNVPLSSLVKSLMDWTFQSLDANSDIGLDPREGAIEIEAKIGTLVDENTGERMVLPVRNAVVLAPGTENRYQFESQMLEAAHQRMNKYLNECLVTSREQKGRTPIDYKHIKEVDSFRTLSKYGIGLLPQCAQKRYRRELRLRTSVDQKTGRVTARIVKVKLAELQIHSPGESYDCRISMNLEVNLDRPDIDLQQLTEEPTHEKPAQPDRVKDRLSYKHLAYSTDLTRVDTKGLSPKYELELEVDANTLRHQKHLMQTGQENGYQAVVEGFMENLTLLMRQPKQ
ncbi:unnamed protein product [Zymoseptoria tritici ST99CH_1A5]|uniref:mRNA-capping enzyme subunit beta n=1 Tax=Zymoseptoria tritici ST99CH_1A5 TaxID=1276529 RepID=A0A1Y6LJA0_ZYMTR|nr:unnamed protein product [Zymoseptoria tritici ST99CH_1A5]